MTSSQLPVLEFPAMFRGYRGAVRRDVRVQGQGWVREYLETGGFTQPRRMLQVPPGEVLMLDPVADPNLIPRPGWRLYMLCEASRSLNGGVPKEERQRIKEAFESFCLNSPWGALDSIVSRPTTSGVERMARRLAALLRFWDVLQGPRYGYVPSATRTFADLSGPANPRTLAEIIVYIYGMTLEAWCPGGPASMDGQLSSMVWRMAGAPPEMTLETWCPGGAGAVREHLARTVERLGRATREECMEAVLRLIPVLVQNNTGLKHREELSDSRFLRERLATLPPADWEDISGADRNAVNRQLYDWDRRLGRL